MFHNCKNTYTVAFFGHRKITDVRYAENKLDEIISKTYNEYEYIVFLVGKDGDFDRIVSSSVKKAQRAFGTSKSSHVWVLPYLTADLQSNEDYYRDYYDEIELATNILCNCHYKSAFWKRNKLMVDRSDLVVVYVDHRSQGAYAAYKYALKSGKDTINIASEYNRTQM